MKKGLCFVCHQPGHRATEHKKGETRTKDRPFPKNKGREAYSKIRAIMKELDEEGKEKALALIGDKGF